MLQPPQVDTARMELGLDGKSALVLAASKGLGYAIAKSLCDEGVRTVICSSSSERIENAAASIGAIPLQADLDDPCFVSELIQSVRGHIGTPDIIVINCAGPESEVFLKTSTLDWERNFHRLWAIPIELLKSFLPGMKERNYGRVIWVTSVAAKQIVPGVTISSSLRSGLHGLVKSLSDEFAPHGITVNAVLPGFMITDRLGHLALDDLSKVHIPAGRFGTPAEFGSLATFIASEQAAYITGQAIACDGGWLRS